MKRSLPMHALWWLLLLLPGGALVALDLVHDVSRPGVWLVRALPALLVLGGVAFASARSSAFAVRLCKELRLALLTALLLLGFSGSVLCLDALPEGWLLELVRTMPFVLGVVLPAAAVLGPMTLELERGTLQHSFTTPLGARAFAEKFGLAAVLVVLSWLQLSAVAERGSELWWFALAGHLLALATGPAWFFFAQGEGTPLGFVVLVPFLMGVPALLWPAAVIPLLVLYGVTMLALTPRAVARGVAAGPLGWMRAGSSSVSFIEQLAPPLWRAELRGQRDALLCAAAGLLSFAGIRLFGGEDEAASLALVAFVGVAAMLSPVLAFTEGRRLGTLEAELSVRPRREVFTRHVLVSALTTGLSSVLLPLAVLLPSAKGALAVLLLMVLAWCLGLAVAVHLRAVGTALAVGLCLGLAVFFAHAALMALGTWGALVVFDAVTFPNLGPFLVAALVVMATASAAVAARRFLKADRLEPRVLVLASALSLTHAAISGALSVLASQ